MLNSFNLGIFIVPNCRYVDNAPPQVHAPKSHPLWHNPMLHFITNNYLASRHSMNKKKYIYICMKKQFQMTDVKLMLQRYSQPHLEPKTKYN